MIFDFISPTATFTVVPITIFAVGTFVKLRKRFCLLANTADFHYDWLRHGRLLLINDYCLEPVAAQTAFGLLYNSRPLGVCQ